MTDGPRRCFLHVGMPKTGTSYLQSILWRSGPALAAQGVTMLPGSAAETFRTMLDLRGQLRPELDPPEAFGAFDRFREAASGCRTPHALVTQELLGGATVEQVRRLLDAVSGFEPHLVLTLRDPAGFAASAWQQHVKARGTKPYDVFLEDLLGTGDRPLTASYDPLQVLDRWGSQIPPHRVHVVTLPRRGASQHELLERFCRVVEVDPGSLDSRRPKANTSLGLVQAELLRRVNLALGDRLPHRRAGYREQGKQFLAGKVLHPQGGPPPRVPEQLRDRFDELADALVERIRSGGYLVVGDLAELRPDPGIFVADEQQVADADLAAAAAEALATVLDRRAAERRQLAELRTRVREQQRRLDELTAAASDLESRGTHRQAGGQRGGQRRVLPRALRRLRRALPRVTRPLSGRRGSGGRV